MPDLPFKYRALPLHVVLDILRGAQDPQPDGYFADDAATRQAIECLQVWRWVTVADGMVIFERPA